MALSKASFFTHLKTLTKPHLHHPAPPPLLSLRRLSFATPEEAAAERRRRKRRLRIEPPLSSLRHQQPQQAQPRQNPNPNPNPNSPKLPEPVSALSGNRLNLHNRILALIRVNDLDEAALLTRHSIYSNCRPTIFTVNSVLAALLRQSRYSDLLSLHRFITQAGVAANVVTHNLLINAYLDCRKTDTALEHYKQLINDAPFNPSPTTYRILIKGLVDNGKVERALELKEEMLDKGFAADPVVYSYLMLGHVRNSNADGVFELYEELKDKLGDVDDGVVVGSLMKGYFLRGMEKEAMRCYAEAVGEGSKIRMSAVAFNSVLDALSKNGKFDEAMLLFDRMMAEHNPPRRLSVNLGSFNVMVDGFCAERRFKDAIEVFRKTGEKRCSPDTLSYNNLIEQLCNNGMLTEAEELYGEMTNKGVNPDEFTYVLLMDTCFQENRTDDAAGYFRKMVETGLRPNLAVYSKLVDGLVKVGKIDEAKSFYDLMVKKLKMDEESYKFMMMALFEVGKHDEVLKMIGDMLDDDASEFTTDLQEFIKEELRKEGREEDVVKLMEDKEREKAEARAKEAAAAEAAKASAKAAVSSLLPSKLFGSKDTEKEPDVVTGDTAEAVSVNEEVKFVEQENSLAESGSAAEATKADNSADSADSADIDFKSNDRAEQWAYPLNFLLEPASSYWPGVFELPVQRVTQNFHLDICKLIIRLFKWKNVPLEKCLAILWEYRRINHALCTSPIDEAFIMTFTEHCGENSKDIDFWISCIKGSQPLLVGFLQIFSFLFTNLPQGSCHQKSSFRVDITVDEVKDAAEKLISRVPVSSCSVFLAGYLYYDLCERLTSNGRLIEALSFAKQAHQLRSKLFQEKFIQNYTPGLSDLQTFRLVATEVWSFNTISWELESCDLSPWNVLQCYLESTLQVGIIHEMIGNGTEAEALLRWGKMISSSQDLPLFIVSFSSMLGKLYCKKRIWDLAEKELQTAKQVMVDSSTAISCLKCRLILEATIDQQLGDLYRSHLDFTTENLSIKRLSFAENLYKSALDKLNLSEWKNSISSPEESCAESLLSRKNLYKDAEYKTSSTVAYSATNQLDAVTLVSTGEVPKVKMETRSRKAKKASQILPQEQCLTSQNNSRLTRSKYRACQDKSVSIQAEEQAGLTKYSNRKYVPAGTDPFSQKGSHVDEISSKADFGSEITCICNNMRCWHCLPIEVMESGLVNNFIFMKWEFVRRRLSLRLLTGIGKCLGGRGEIHETHEIFLQSIFVLMSRNPFSYASSYVRPNFLLDLIGKEIPGDVFSVEHAAIIYNICWFSLKNYRSQDTRNICCDQFHIQITKIVSWLMLAFVLCREVPLIFQKVSRLLAAIYLLSASSEPFSLSSSSCKALSESHWASYFHQASLGTHLNHQFFSNMAGKLKTQNLLNVEGSHSTGPNCIRAETCNLLRLAPESLQGLEEFVMKFFEDLPCTTVICISLLGGALASLLRELLNYPSSIHAWVLLSRLNLKSQPVVVLLPVDSVLEEVSDDDASSESEIHYEHKDLGKQWHCPWGSTVVDDVAPAFKTILEENYLSSSTFPLEDTKENRLQWWTQRKKLDHRLGKLLRDLEDLWLGPWRYLLLGECLDCEHLDMIHKKLVHDLKSKCKMDVNESLLKIILRSARYSHGREECFSQLYLNKGCYIGGAGFYDEKTRCEVLSNPCDRVEKKSALANQLICGAAEELEEEESVNREPIILVLDCEVQMLPWENLPVLRTQEAYRMPSVGSISAILDRSHHRQEQAGTDAAAFPLIDPLDAFYLLNPSGDLSSSQAAFEKWFRDQNIEGKAGIAPTVEELAGALKSHDLFIYIGHGSGAQYIPRHEIQKLENCAATLLMGCSSGSLSLNGQYTPQGTHLSYLSAGSPVIVANLWEVTDKDIDRFGKAMLDAWLRERSSPSVVCAQCRLVNELKSMNIKGDAKKKIPRKKLSKACSSVICEDYCNHRPKIGSFMSQAREACTLPFLIGASPVCYGVPTGIQKKKDS